MNTEIHKVIEQNNYTNQCLKTIGKQLDKIETKIDSNPIENSPSTSKVILENPIIKLPSNRNKLGLETTKKENKNIKKIEEIFSRLETKNLKEEKSSIKVINKKEIKTTHTESSSDTDIEQIENQFNINKIVNHKFTPTVTKN